MKIYVADSRSLASWHPSPVPEDLTYLPTLLRTYLGRPSISLSRPIKILPIHLRVPCCLARNTYAKRCSQISLMKQVRKDIRVRSKDIDSLDLASLA